MKAIPNLKLTLKQGTTLHWTSNSRSQVATPPFTGHGTQSTHQLRRSSLVSLQGIGVPVPLLALLRKLPPLQADPPDNGGEACARGELVSSGMEGLPHEAMVRPCVYTTRCILPGWPTLLNITLSRLHMLGYASQPR